MATKDVVMGEKDFNFSEAICSICDNGGDLICCEGRCLRSFHATVEHGIDTACESLELSPNIIKGTFLCENCQYNQHQCHVCGKLGSSDRSTGAEVFQCGDCACGYFYHPSCVANALRFKFGDVAKDIETEIASGQQFTCPLHYCHACKQKEQDESSVVMQFAVCRRCPIAYHRKCLPRDIAFEDDNDEGIIKRAWDDLIPNKILIYCMDHVIHEDLQTPPRDHLKFPYTNIFKENRGKELVSDSLGKRTPPSKGARQVEKSSLGRKRFSGLYSLREPKKRFASKSRLQESSSISYMNSSGIYSFRDRRMVTKYSMAPLLSGLKKKICKHENDSSSQTDMDALLSSTDRSNDSEKRRNSSTEVEEHSDMTGVEEQRECDEKEVTACGDDSVVSNKLKNQQSSSSEKKTKSSDDIAAECENDSLANILKNRHLKQSKISKEVVAAASGNEKKSKRSGNGHSFGSSKKRSKIIAEAAPVPTVFGLCAQGSEIFEKLRDSTARNLENNATPRSEKIVRSSKEVDASGSEKERKSSENRTSIGSSEKQSKIIKAVAPVPTVFSLCAQGSEIFENLRDSTARNLENHATPRSEKLVRSSKEVDQVINIKVLALEKERKSSENRTSIGSSEKQSKIIKEVAPVSGASKMQIPKVCGSEKRCESTVEVKNTIACGSENRSAVKVAGSEDSVPKKLENPKASSSGKQSDAVGKPADSIDRKLDNPSARGSVKRIESAEKLACCKVSVSRNLDNSSAMGLEKRVESSEKLAGSTESLAKELDNPSAGGSEKQIESAEKLTGSKYSVGTKLENPNAHGSEMVERAENLANRIKDSLCTKLEDPKASDLEKRSGSVVNQTCSKDSEARKMGNNVNNPGSEKTGKTSRTVEASGIPGSEKQRKRPKEAAPYRNEAMANTLEKKKPKGSGSGSEKKKKRSEKKTKLIKEAAAAVSGANKLMKPTSESVEKVASIGKEAATAVVVKIQAVDKVESSSKKDSSQTTTNTADGNQSCSRSAMKTPSNGAANGSRPGSYKSLDFYKGPYSPPTENNSVGWLID